MVVVIGQRAATGDDDGEWDSNSANVDLAVITQSVAVPSQRELKKTLASIMRTPPRMQRRPVNLSLIGTNSATLQEVYDAGQARAEKKRLIVVVTVIVIERKVLSKRIIRHPANKQNTCGGV